LDLGKDSKCPGFIHLNRFAKRWCDRNCAGQHATTRMRATVRLASSVMTCNCSALGRSVEELWYKHSTAGRYFHPAALPMMAKEFYGSNVRYDSEVACQLIRDADAFNASRRNQSVREPQARAADVSTEVELATLHPDEILHSGARAWWTHGEDACVWWHAAAQGIHTPQQMRESLMTVDLPCNIVLNIHRGTGMVRGSDIAVSAGKQIIRWLQLGITCENSGTKGVAQAVSAKYGIDIKNLAVGVANGIWQGTWVHMCMVNDLARWCDPVYAVHTDDIVMRFLNGTLTSEESQHARAAIDASASTSTCTRPAAASAGSTGLALRRQVRSTSAHPTPRRAHSQAPDAHDGHLHGRLGRRRVHYCYCYCCCCRNCCCV
jgi:hypothetical protein